jgi:hypothetical protein
MLFQTTEQGTVGGQQYEGKYVNCGAHIKMAKGCGQ